MPVKRQRKEGQRDAWSLSVDLASALRDCTSCRLQTQDRKLQKVIIARIYIYRGPAPPNFVQLRIRTLLTIRTFLLAAESDAVLTLSVCL